MGSWSLPVTASLVAGISLWFTRASLDVFPSFQGAIRVAMFPSGWSLLFYMAICIMAGIAIALIAGWFLREPTGRHRRGRTMITPTPAVQQIFLSLFALGLLVLPYLPWLPDRLPLLQVLAGPVRFLLWIVVLAQSVFVAISLRKQRANGRVAVTEKLQETSVRTSRRFVSLIAIFLTSLIAFGATAFYITRSDHFPTGDEPHYMIIMQSLWHDRDLKIENNYRLMQYKDYYQLPLRPHYIARGRDGEIYSIHPIGMPVLAMPAFAMAGYPGVVGLLILVGATAATLLWRWVYQAWGSSSTATFAWAAACLTTPYLFNTFTVYPEIMGALCVMIGLTWNLTSHQPDGTHKPRVAPWPLLLQGLAIGLLPWLSTKYAPMSAALIAVLLWRLRRSLRACLVVITPYVLSLAAWFSFFYITWGTFNPGAPYGKSNMTHLSNFAAGGPGLFFDQEYGILIYAPVLIFGLTGLIFMLLRRGETARIAVEIAMVGGTLLVTVGSHEIWWGGAATPCRHIASGILLLGLPVGWSFSQTSDRLLRRMFQYLLLIISLSISAFLVLFQHGILSLNYRDGASDLLQWISSNWHVWALFPSYIFHNPLIASAYVTIWLAAAAILALLARYVKVNGPGHAALIATLSTVIVIIGISIVIPAILKDKSQPPVDLEARFNISILDNYDALFRPLSVIYDPFRRIPVESVPPLMSFTASPYHHHNPQIIPLLWNARFSLPAGRYKILMRPRGNGPISGRLGMQIGRNGPPLEEWMVETSEGKPWEMEFTLPIDSTFVGFRSLAGLDASMSDLRLVPLHIVDASRRLPFLQVLGAIKYTQATVFFHDDNIFPLSTDIWTKGWAEAYMTILPNPGASVLRLQVRSCVNMTITIRSHDFTERIVLAQNQNRDVVIPINGMMIRLSIESPDGFIPAEINPADSDRRALGCHIEFDERH